MNDQRRQLQHDIGKYISRIARNVAGRALDTTLLGLLAKDLYEAVGGGGRPSQRFAALAGCLPTVIAAAISTRFVELDALEAAVRAGDQRAARMAVAIALDITRAIDEAVGTA